MAAFVLSIHEHRQHKAENHKESPEKYRSFLEHVRSLCTKGLVCHLSAEGSAESFLFWALHEHNQQQQRAHDEQQGKYDVDGGLQKHVGGDCSGRR